MSCLTSLDVELLLADELSAARERDLRRHVQGCPECAERLEVREPSRVFARPPRLTLPAAEWAGVMQAVRAEVERRPRRQAASPRPVQGLAWLRVAAAWGSAAAALALVALSTALLDTPRGARSLPGPRAVASPGSFVYLSNPAAKVTHVVLGGEGGEPAVQLTMIVDADLEDLF